MINLEQIKMRILEQALERARVVASNSASGSEDDAERELIRTFDRSYEIDKKKSSDEEIYIRLRSPNKDEQAEVLVRDTLFGFQVISMTIFTVYGALEYHAIDRELRQYSKKYYDALEQLTAMIDGNVEELHIREEQVRTKSKLFDEER